MYNILIEDIASSVVVSKQVVAGVDNLVCTRRGTTEVIVEYNHDSVFYAMFWIYIAGICDNCSWLSIDNKKFSISDELDFYTKLHPLLIKKTYVKVEFQESFLDVFFEYIFYVNSPEVPDEYYCKQEYIRRHSKR